MKKIKQLTFSGGIASDNATEKIASLERHYGITIPTGLTERIYPNLGGLFRTTRKVGIAGNNTVYWLTLLNLALPTEQDWKLDEIFSIYEKSALIPNPLSHFIIPIYMERYAEKFYTREQTLRLFPFGTAYRYYKSQLECGFLCFEVTDGYSVWYVSEGSDQEYMIAKTFEEMMLFPQKKAKPKKSN